MRCNNEKLEKKACAQVAKVTSTLQAIMKKRGLSAYGLNRAAGLSDRTIGMILGNKATPQLKVLVKICNAMDMKLSEFMKEAGL